MDAQDRTRPDGWTPPEEVRIRPAEVFEKAESMTAEECRRWVLDSMRACMTGEAEPGTDGARLLDEAEARRERRRRAGRQSGEARRRRARQSGPGAVDDGPSSMSSAAPQEVPGEATGAEERTGPEPEPSAPQRPQKPPDEETLFDRYQRDPEEAARSCPADALPVIAELWEETAEDAPGFFNACVDILKTLPAGRFREILVARMAEGWRGRDAGRTLLERLEQARNRWRAYGF